MVTYIFEYLVALFIVHGEGAVSPYSKRATVSQQAKGLLVEQLQREEKEEREERETKRVNYFKLRRRIDEYRQEVSREDEGDV